MSMIIAYMVSIFGGYIITGGSMWIMYRSIGQKRRIFRWMHFWVGAAERAVATTLVIWGPSQLGGFIGGWMALKIAANWNRRIEVNNNNNHLLALVGSVVSLSVAIAAGIAINRSALVIWAK